MGAILEVKNLKKSFGGIQALKDVSFDVAEGEILGLIGPNGSGKSTFVNTVCGLYRPDGGKVALRGKDITGLEPAMVARAGVARTFQASRPFLNLTVLDNVIVAALMDETLVDAAEKHAREAIEITGLSQYLNTKSCNLPVEKRKRLDLCRALALKPSLLMLDEVMAGLNPKEMEDGLELVRSINRQGVTVIFIEHVMKAVVSLCHRVVVFDQGNMLADGEPQAVMQDERVVKAYLGGSYKPC
jgi:ABC-type branched-subunit amino acid transport system ATPase component